MTGLLKAKSETWIEFMIDVNDLPDDIDFIDWKPAHQNIMIDVFFMSLDKDIRHDIICEIDGLMINSDLSPISEHSKRSRQQSEFLLTYMAQTVNNMMNDYDSSRVERA